jgi:hypothetical protein
MAINVNGAVSTASGYKAPDLKEDLQPTAAQAEKAAETTALPKVDTFSPDLDKISQMKAEAGNNIAAFKKMVYSLLKEQGGKFFEAVGEKEVFQIDEATQLAAQQAIAEDGEWGVEAVSNRLLEFAKALSGGDPSKIEELRNAVKAGFGAARNVWGGEMPGITGQTYARTMELFDEWAAEFA